MKLISVIFFLLITYKSFGQNNDIWTSFQDDETNLIGYKNLKGEIMIPPKFFMISSESFNSIISVMEPNSIAWKNYFLLKDGTELGKDSLYIFDNTPDCEREGFIRFRDRKTDLTGMFNKKGKVAIPAEYSDLKKIQNGVTVGLKNATKEYWDKEENHSGCNHWSWMGGKEVLLNKNNEILVEDFLWDKNINFYSLLVSDKPINDSIRVNFLGVNGKYYSFINNEKLFINFLKNEILPDLSIENLSKYSYSDIIYWKKNKGWISSPKEHFFKKNSKVILERLSEITKENADYFISIGDYISMPDEMALSFDYAYNDCGDWNDSKYPIYDIIVNHYKNNKFLFQDHFEFIKIGDEIKFIGCTIRGVELK